MLLQHVADRGAKGIDMATFARVHCAGKPMRGRRISGCSLLLAELVAQGLVVRIGETGRRKTRYARHFLSAKGREFLESFDRPLPEQTSEPSELAYVVGDSLPEALEPGLYGPSGEQGPW